MSVYMRCRGGHAGLRPAVVSNNLGLREKVMTNPDDDPRSTFQLLQSLERKLDKQIENSRYAIKHDEQRGN